MNSSALARRNLDKRLAPLRALALATPARGWVRAVREALGLTATQLARRLKVSQSRVSALEKAEANGGVTLRSLREAAEAMDCTLVYALVPSKPLEDLLSDRAARVADQDLRRVSHTMRLENQGLTPDDLEAERARLIAELLAGSPRRLWDAP